MNKRKLCYFCTWMLAFSILIRTASSVGAEARLEQTLCRAPEEICRTAECPPKADVWLLQMAESPAEQPAAIEEESPQEPPPAPAEPEPREALQFLPEEADAISIVGRCTYRVDKAALLQQPSGLDFSVSGPKILIVHTHSSEAYTQEAGWEYTPSDPLRTENAERSVIRVGEEIASVLNDAGIETLHDTALHDYPVYNGAYDRALSTIETYLQQYPSIQMVLDVHRDATQDKDGNPTDFTTLLDGEACAQVMLVIGTDEGGLPHPNWQENLANALKLQAVLNRQAPGLCRDLDLRTERFNEHLTPGSMLAEFGSTGNTLAEAIRAGRYFAEGLVTLIGGLPTA